nr:hypothetical protein [Tanacetum cinerariifolium]
ILTTIGVDPNAGIYPLAYAVVESKTKQSWIWFFDCLVDDLELFRNLNLTFFTDMQKGIIPALAETFPATKHKYCLKHIYDNIMLQWRGKIFKELLWRCATATIVSHFDRFMKELKSVNKDVYDCNYRGLTSYILIAARPHCDVLLNNMCEVLNRQLLDGRDKPIITCLEFIREYLMKRIVIVEQSIFSSCYLFRNLFSSNTMGDVNPIRAIRDYSKPSHEATGIPLSSSRTIDQTAGGRLCNRNAKESWALLDGLALYDNESWNGPRDFAKAVKAVSSHQDVPSTFDHRLIEFKNQVQRLMKAYIAPMQPTQVNKITSSCKICSDPHDTQYCMEYPEQAFVDYASSRTDEA